VIGDISRTIEIYKKYQQSEKERLPVIQNPQISIGRIIHNGRQFNIREVMQRVGNCFFDVVGKETRLRRIRLPNHLLQFDSASIRKATGDYMKRNLELFTAI
jgi:hypothetical protein